MGALVRTVLKVELSVESWTSRVVVTPEWVGVASSRRVHTIAAVSVASPAAMPVKPMSAWAEEAMAAKLANSG